MNNFVGQEFILGEWDDRFVTPIRVVAEQKFQNLREETNRPTRLLERSESVVIDHDH